MLLVVLLGEVLSDGEGDGWIVTRRINILLYEVHFLPETFLEVRREVIQCEGHTCVCIGGVVVARLDIGRVFVCNDIAYEFNSRVALAAVTLFLLLGGDDDILQCVGVRVERDLDVLARLSLAQDEFLGLVTDHLEVQNGISLWIANVVTSFHIGGRTKSCRFSVVLIGLHEEYLHKGQVLACLTIYHLSRCPCQFLGVGTERADAKAEE